MVRFRYKASPSASFTVPYLVRVTLPRVVESAICPRCAEREDLFHFFNAPVLNLSGIVLLHGWEKDGGGGGLPIPWRPEWGRILIVGSWEVGGGDFSLFNYILLWAKFYIYKTTSFGLGEPDLFQFLLELKNRLSVERQCRFADFSFHKRFKKWEKVL